MGLLDDAIREHLELKRRHGADPGDVARQEREVLGAEQRAAAEAAAPESPPGDRTRVLEPEDELPADEPDVAEAPAPGEEAGAPGYDEDPWLAEEPDEVPAEESLERPPAAGEEDVLEETPDFLQETPEHERLWFEQRPPRDFDWDK